MSLLYKRDRGKVFKAFGIRVIMALVDEVDEAFAKMTGGYPGKDHSFLDKGRNPISEELNSFGRGLPDKVGKLYKKAADYYDKALKQKGAEKRCLGGQLQIYLLLQK